MRDHPFLDLYSIAIFSEYIISVSGNQSWTRGKYNVFASRDETLALFLLTLFYTCKRICSDLLFHSPTCEFTFKHNNDPSASPRFLAIVYVKEEMFCFKFIKIKKSTENPVGGWSRGGPPSSCDGSINGEATPNALMEPRFTSHTLTQHNITEQHLMFSAYQLFANFTLPNFFPPLWE